MEQIIFKLREEEKEKILEASKKLSLSVSAYCRSLAIQQADKMREVSQ